AISVVLNCSQSAEELLKRRKVVREAILKYLIRHDVVTSASADKQQLINKALFYWIQEEWKKKKVIDKTNHNLLLQVRKQELEQKEIEKAKVRAVAQRELEQARQVEDQLRRQVEEQARRREEEQRRQAEEQRRQAEEQRRRQVEEQARQAEEQRRRQVEEQARRAEEQRRRQVEEQARQAEEQRRRQVEEQIKKQGEAKARRELEEQIKRQVQEQMREQAQDEATRQLEIQMNINLNITQCETLSQTDGDFDCQMIGEKFCQWFFILLNSQNPSFGRQPEEWGPQHFWEDAILHFAYSVLEHTSEQQKTEQYQSSAMVSQRLLSLVKDEQLLFNPNISKNGMRSVTSKHGIVVVAVAGTVHKNTQCLGIFEQLFGLVRTPVGRSNWKIKYVNLQMKALSGQQEISQPSLSVEQPALMAHLNELSVLFR
ncbi:hypothetical protein scyTo_0009814, partial [Scyliorhinus torazame]|nr:hypothetical protein [Scyliorhinus torazame]